MFKKGDLVKRTDGIETCDCGCMEVWEILEYHEEDDEYRIQWKSNRKWISAKELIPHLRKKTGFGAFVCRIEE